MSINSWDRLRTASWTALAGAVVLLTAHAASAQECEADVDCDDGYVCKSYGTTSCPAAEPCAQGDQECAKKAPPTCEQMEFKQCAPAPCEADSDCPANMACHEYQTGGCSGSGSAPATNPCAPGEDCAAADPAPRKPAPEEQECMFETVSECTPRYALPCTEDTDCGEGFTCKEQISVSCSGSSGSATPSDSGGQADSGGQDAKPQPLPPEDTCMSEPTGTFYCELQELPCDADTDCPADFECMNNPNRAVCNSAGAPALPPDQRDGEVPAGDEPADAGAADRAPVDSCGNANDGLAEKTCLPLHYYESRGIGVAEDAVAGGGTAATPPMSSSTADDKGSDGRLADSNSAGTPGSGEEHSAVSDSDAGPATAAASTAPAVTTAPGRGSSR